MITQPALRAFYATAAAFGLTLAVMDVRNCFQNNMIDPDKRVFVRTPPRYMEWFKRTFPDVIVPHSPTGNYANQTMGTMQGEKDAGHS